MKDLLAIFVSGCCLLCAGREFVHPGITYTQGDLDRIKAMVDAGREPYASAFEKLKTSPWSSLDAEVVERGSVIPNDRFNHTIGRDGRRAIDLALLWHLTGDERYARKAVEFINASSHYLNVSTTGTLALENGKINLLVEAAELLRDYPGWDAADQERFRKMVGREGCFYNNLKNFDAGRFGNQGLFAARALLAIGVYLDDEKMYERVVRYLTGQPHRKDDEPYVPGPPVDGWVKGENEYQKEWQWSNRFGDTVDWGYDEQILHYIQPNGQTQESSRDQGHSVCGVNMLVNIAEIAWNQGDDLYSFGDNRILKAQEWTYRYNLSFVLGQPWEPTGYTTKPEEATFENGLYLQYRHRSGRWMSLKPSPIGRGDAASSGGMREAALAHYQVRAKLPKSSYEWLAKYRDYMIEKHGLENWGTAPNWYYEWPGWGTLTKRRTKWMAGDPVRWKDGRRVSGAHKIPGRAVKWSDFDYYPANGEGKVFHHEEKNKLSAGDWRAFTVTCEKEGDYDIYIGYSSWADARIAASIDGAKAVAGYLPKSKMSSKTKLLTIHVPAGASVLRLAIVDAGRDLKIGAFQIVPSKK